MAVIFRRRSLVSLVVTLIVSCMAPAPTNNVSQMKTEAAGHLSVSFVLSFFIAPASRSR
jgi:hypothetical protein